MTVFYWKNKCSKVLNGDVNGTSRGPNDGTFWERLWDVGHACFLNPTQKYIKLTLAGYSRLYSECIVVAKNSLNSIAIKKII